MAQVTLDGVVYEEIVQAKFRKWLELEAIRDQITKAVENVDKQAELVCQYVSTALSLSVDRVAVLDWREVSKALVELITVNHIELELPFLKFPHKEDKRLSWDYEGRNWWSFAQTFAKAFGWTLEYIANLDVVEAMHLFEEIIVEDQLDKEWQWLLSERAVKYNESTKKYEPNPLPRPNWMQDIPMEAKKIKIRKDFLPVGAVIRARPSDQEYFVN